MKRDTKIRSGYRVIGPNTADYTISTWYFPDEESANKFAEHLCRSLDGKVCAEFEIEILKYVGCWRPVPRDPRPIEYISGDQTCESQTDISGANTSGAEQDAAHGVEAT